MDLVIKKQTLCCREARPATMGFEGLRMRFRVLGFRILGLGFWCFGFRWAWSLREERERERERDHWGIDLLKEES